MAEPAQKSNFAKWFPVGLLLTIFVIIGACFFIGRAVMGIDHLSDEEIRNGRACTATVISATETSNAVNHKPVWEFKLKVDPADGEPYEATIRDTINQIEAGKIAQAGAEFKCVIDRDDSSRVEVFWS